MSRETISRRELLQTTVALLLPSACTGTSYDSSSVTTSSAAACPGVAAESSQVEGHTHGLCVPTIDLDSPPEGGATYTTTESESHTHLVKLDPNALNAINGGQSVTAVTSITNGHEHTFLIVKANVSRAGGAGGPANGGGQGSGAGTGNGY
jgi:hypothetical protein